MLRYLASYEGRIKSFLLLLVLFLAAAIAVSFHALVLGRDALAEEVRERVRVIATAVQRDLGLGSEGLPRADEAILGSALQIGRFERLARVHSLISLEVLDPEGRVVVSSLVGRPGVRDRAWGSLKPAERTSLATGRFVSSGGPGAEGVSYSAMIGLFPLRVPSGRLSGVLRIEAPAENLALAGRSLRILSIIQATALGSLLLLVLFFSRWLVAPYRRLAATAGQAVPGAGMAADVPEPDFLVDSFRTVLDKLRTQEQELHRLRGDSGAVEGEFPAENLARDLASGLITCDASQRVRLVNPAAERILGRPAAALSGRAAAELFPEEGGLGRLIADALRVGTPRSREMVPLRRPDGREVHLGVGLSPIVRSGGEVRGVVCLLSDLTEIRLLRDRVALKENLARLGEMSAGIAHEFRNSLATLAGYARLLERTPDPAVCEMGAAVSREVKGIGRTVDDFLRFARPVALNVSPVDLRGLLEELGREMARPDHSASLRLTVEGEFPPLPADEVQLRQAFHNLFLNAAQAGNGHGVRVTVSGKVEEGNILRVDVADDGPGIPPDVLPRIFTPFFTTRPEGIGLGLPLVQKSVVSHDGTIEVESRMGEGTRFTLRFPLRRPEVSPPPLP